MLTKIKYRYQQIVQSISQLRDIRIVGLLVFVAIVLMISWSGVKVIDTNYQLQREIAQLQQQAELQELSNRNQELENAYFETPQYLELAAREGFGMAAPGESVVIVPKAVALKYTVDTAQQAQAEVVAAEDQRPAYQQNFQAWMDFFFHRNRATD
jgi:cell division protein FtsL